MTTIKRGAVVGPPVGFGVDALVGPLVGASVGADVDLLWDPVLMRL